MEHGRRPTASVERGCCLVGVEMVLHVVRDSREGGGLASLLVFSSHELQCAFFSNPKFQIPPLRHPSNDGSSNPWSASTPHKPRAPFCKRRAGSPPVQSHGAGSNVPPRNSPSMSKPLEKREKNGASRHLQRLRQGSGADMPLLPRGHLLLAFLPRHESPTARPDLPNPRNTPTKSQPALATGSRGAVP